MARGSPPPINKCKGENQSHHPTQRPMAPQWEGLNVVAQTVTGTQGSIIKLNRTPCNGVQPPTPQLKLERDHLVLLSESWVQEVGIASAHPTGLWLWDISWERGMW